MQFKLWEVKVGEDYYYRVLPSTLNEWQAQDVFNREFNKEHMFDHGKPIKLDDITYRSGEKYYPVSTKEDWSSFKEEIGVWANSLEEALARAEVQDLNERLKDRVYQLETPDFVKSVQQDINENLVLPEDAKKEFLKSLDEKDITIEKIEKFLNEAMSAEEVYTQGFKKSR